MSYTDAFESSPSKLWSIVALVVEAGLSFYEENPKVAAMQLVTAGLTYQSGVMGALARLLIELYKQQQ